MERKINQELYDICSLVVAGIDRNPKFLPNDFRFRFGTQEKALEHAVWAATTPNLDDSIQFDEYVGGSQGNQQYRLKGYHHEIVLSEKQARDIVIGIGEGAQNHRLNVLPVSNFNPDFRF